MPKKVVPLVTGETYHIFNRGVDKRDVFVDKVDYWRFHTSLQIFNAQDQAESVYRRRFRAEWITTQEPLVQVNAYCLLKNHYHLILTQVIDGGVSEFMKRLGGGYTGYFNERYERSGALFQGNYKRVHCATNEQLLYLAVYVNYNNLVHSSKDYFLSSADAYIGKRVEPFVKSSLILDQYDSSQDFATEAKATVHEIAKKRKQDKEYRKDDLIE